MRKTRYITLYPFWFSYFLVAEKRQKRKFKQTRLLRYFKNGKLLHQINNQDCGALFDSNYLLEEQKRIQADFDKLIDLRRK